MRIATLCRAAALVALAALLCAPPALADEIADQIREGLKLYEAGKYTEAAQTLNFASGQIQQKHASGLKNIFPEPLKGWKAEDSSTETAQLAMLGGGISASRRYFVDGSEKSVQIEIVTDSPLLQPMMMFFTNPAILGSQPGMKLVTLKGRKAVQKFVAKDKDCEIHFVLQNRMLVSVKGDGMGTPDETLAYADAINFDALEKFLAKN